MGFITYLGGGKTVFTEGNWVERLILPIPLRSEKFEDTRKQVFFLKDPEARLYGIGKASPLVGFPNFPGPQLFYSFRGMMKGDFTVLKKT